MPSAVPSTSRTAVVRQFRAPLRIEEVPIPTELEPGAILTRIEMCSICGTDVHLWQRSLALRVAAAGPLDEVNTALERMKNYDST